MRIALPLALGLGIAALLGCAERQLGAVQVAAAPAPPAVPLALTAVVPAGGHPAGGTAITLTGQGFGYGVGVSVGGTPALHVRVVSATEITAATPPGTAGPADVRVTLGVANATLTAGFLYTTVPAVMGVSPATGDAAGGTLVTVTGAAFPHGVSVSFGTSTAYGVRTLDSGRVVAYAPAGSAGTVGVTVSIPMGGSGTLANAFTYGTVGTAPNPSGVSPSAGPAAGGTAITVTGSGFQTGAGVAVAGLAAATTVVDANTLVATAPPMFPGLFGTNGITVTNPGGGTGTVYVPGFTYTPVLVESLSDAAAGVDLAAGGTAGTLHAVWEAQGTTDTLRHATSTDDGRTWGSAATVATLASQAAQARLAAAGNVLAVSWLAGSTATDHAWSTDAGSTWSTTSLGLAAAADVAVDPNGRVCLVWVGPNTHPSAPSGATGVFARTGPVGGPYGAATLVSGTCGAGHVAVTCGGVGRFLIAFAGATSFASAPGDAWLVATSDGGATFAAPARLSSVNASNNESVVTVAIAAGQGRAVVGYCYTIATPNGMGPTPWPPPAAGIFLQGSVDGGVTWGSGLMVSGTSAVPAAAVNADGTLGVSWVIPGGMWGGYTLALAQSFDAGSTVDGTAPIYMVPTVAGAWSAALAGSGRRFAHAWTATGSSGGTPDVLGH